MADTHTTIRTYFTRLGLTTEIADLYLALQSCGPQTISELARAANVERTRIYRLLKPLQSLGLIEVEAKYKHSLILPAPLSNLQILLNQRQSTLTELQAELPTIEQVLAPNPASSPTTKVKYYQGAQGLRQMLWNELRSTTEIIAYSYQILDHGVGRSFMTNWVAEFEKRGLHKRVMFNDSYVKSWYEPPGDRIRGFEYHYIDPVILAVNHTCNIYNDVACYLHWKDGEVFGVEIYNQDMAKVQRQLLNQIWPLSQPETRF